MRNEAAYLSGALTSVVNQDYPGEKIEILVVDGMSNDGTRDVVAQFQNRYPGRKIYLFDNHGKIVPTGMNVGLHQARGDVIVRVDGHCEIAPDYITRCVFYLESNAADGVGGPMTTIGQSQLAESIALAMSSQFGVGNSSFRTVSGKSLLVDTVPFPAYTRQMVEKAGFYDEELVRNQDDEYNYRIRELGGRLLLAGDIHSTYYINRTTRKELWQQYFQYGFWKIRVLQKRPRQMSLRQYVPFSFVMSLLISSALGLWFSWARFLLLIIFGSYVIANLVESFLVAQKRGFRHLLRLPFIFLVLHISYGLGFFIGLLRFWNRWGDKQGRTPQLGSADA